MISNVEEVNFKEHTRWNVDDALKESEGLGLEDVLVVGYDGEGNLCIRSSAMTNAQALYLVERMKNCIMGNE